MSAEEIWATVMIQIMALRVFAPLRHVKPHGALYNLAARDTTVAGVVADAVLAVDKNLVLFALAGSELVKAGHARGLRVAEEVFADRTYQADGSLTPRSRPEALIQDQGTVVTQVLRMIHEGKVRAIDGVDVPIKADTICLHGDGPNAVAFAQRLNVELRKAGIEIKAFS